MKKIEINSLTLITDDNNNVIGGYGICDDESAKPVINKLIAGVVEKATAPPTPLIVLAIARKRRKRTMAASPLFSI